MSEDFRVSEMIVGPRGELGERYTTKKHLERLVQIVSSSYQEYRENYSSQAVAALKSLKDAVDYDIKLTYDRAVYRIASLISDILIKYGKSFENKISQK